MPQGETQRFNALAPQTVANIMAGPPGPKFYDSMRMPPNPPPATAPLIAEFNSATSAVDQLAERLYAAMERTRGIADQFQGFQPSQPDGGNKPDSLARTEPPAIERLVNAIKKAEDAAGALFHQLERFTG